VDRATARRTVNNTPAAQSRHGVELDARLMQPGRAWVRANHQEETGCVEPDVPLEDVGPASSARPPDAPVSRPGLPQVFATDQFHDDPERVPFHDEVDDPDDVGVVDRGEDGAFLNEADHDLGAAISSALRTLTATEAPDSRTLPRETSPTAPRPSTSCST
jgi:hypothetical protein